MGKEIFEEVKKLNLPIGSYVLFGSAPLGIRGIRDCHDIDILVSEDVWEAFKNNGWEVKSFPEGRECLVNGLFELWRTWWPGEWDTDKLIKEAEIIDGLALAKLEEVLKWKKIMNRDKDKKDIELINNYLEQNGNN